MSSGILRVVFSDRGEPASVREAVLSGCGGGESGENLDCSIPKLSGGEIERCSLNLEGFCQGEDVEAMPLEGGVVSGEGWVSRERRVKTAGGGEERERTGLDSRQQWSSLHLHVQSIVHVIVFLKRKR